MRERPRLAPIYPIESNAELLAKPDGGAEGEELAAVFELAVGVFGDSGSRANGALAELESGLQNLQAARDCIRIQQFSPLRRHPYTVRFMPCERYS
jgi:hypothetical protein